VLLFVLSAAVQDSTFLEGSCDSWPVTADVSWLCLISSIWCVPKSNNGGVKYCIVEHCNNQLVQQRATAVQLISEQ
jgi:hypothetical protein